MKQQKAAVYVLLGQSNAVGHGLPMAEADRIRKPLKNVFGLSREANQSFDNEELYWSGYTSFGMNLAEQQDHTYSVANCLAKLWQGHIDNGNRWNLPDLYVIQIAIGAQGVTEGYMWHPDREQKLIPGKLGYVDISLFPFCKYIFGLLDDSFTKMGKEYEIIGLHWRGGENDASTETECLTATLEGIYTRIFDAFNRLLHFPPIVLHRLVCHDRMNDLDPSGGRLANMHYINAVFERLCLRYDGAAVFDVRNAPQYVPDVRCNGIFEKDAVHFTAEVNNWVAACALEDYVNQHRR